MIVAYTNHNLGKLFIGDLLFVLELPKETRKSYITNKFIVINES